MGVWCIGLACLVITAVIGVRILASVVKFDIANLYVNVLDLGL